MEDFRLGANRQSAIANRKCRRGIMADGLTIDASQFLQGLDLADARAVRGCRRGMALSLADLERRCKQAAPIDQSGRKPGGTLAASIVGAADSIVVAPGRIEGKVAAGGGEAADYAITQHEAPLHHTHPTDGVYASKFIEQPLKEMTAKYGELVAGEARKELAS
jgi:hypothetical protein